jgi:hypothetical protein
MYQVQLNHLKSRIGLLANSQQDNTRQGLDVIELCAIANKLLEFIEDISAKEIQP